MSDHDLRHRTLTLGIDPGKTLGYCLLGGALEEPGQATSRLSLIIECGSLSEAQTSSFHGLQSFFEAMRTPGMIPITYHDFCLDGFPVFSESMLTVGRESRAGLVTTARIHERIYCAVVSAALPAPKLVSPSTWRSVMLRGVTQEQGGTAAQRTKEKKAAALKAIPQWLFPGQEDAYMNEDHNAHEAILIACYGRELQIHEAQQK